MFGSTASSPSSWFAEWARGVVSDSGVEVTATTALRYAPVWQAVNVLAGDVAQLPLILYRRTNERDRERARTHPGYRLLLRRPNPRMGAATLKQILTSHALLWGNGYAEIIRDGRAAPMALQVLLPDRTWPVEDNGELLYATRNVETGQLRAIRPENVLHIKGLGFDGLCGHSVIALARNSWGLGMGAEKHGNKFFKNLARPGGLIKLPGKIKPEDAKELIANWNEWHQGLDEAFQTGILSGGADFMPLSMSNEDSQWIELRKFQRSEVASWFNLPPHKLGDDTRVSYNSLEQENQSYLNMALMRWLVTWQEECHEKLLTDAQKAADSHFFEFKTAALLRGDLATRYNAYMIGRTGKWLSANDVRAMENMNSIGPEGDEYENPNTSTAASPEDSGDDNGMDDETQNRLTQLAALEIQRVTEAASREGNFLSWIDKFYDWFRPKLEDTLAECGRDIAAASGYCEASRERLVGIAGHSSQATLADNIRLLTMDWAFRIKDLAQ